MIDYCPDSEEFYWIEENISLTEPVFYHVIYFEGRGTEVTRAWVKAANITRITSPIKQPKGNTLSKPGPLKNKEQ